MSSKKFEKYRKEEKKDCSYTLANVDQKIMEIPIIHSKWLRYFTDEAAYGVKIKAHLDRLYSETYKKYKTGSDIDIPDSKMHFFIFGDKEYSDMKYKFEKQKILIDYLESVLKKISTMQFGIRDLIEWQKFKMGS